MARLGGQIAGLQDVAVVEGVVPVRPDEALEVLVVLPRVLKEMDRRRIRRGLALVQRSSCLGLMDGLAMAADREGVPAVEGADVSDGDALDGPWVRKHEEVALGDYMWRQVFDVELLRVRVRLILHFRRPHVRHDALEQLQRGRPAEELLRAEQDLVGALVGLWPLSCVLYLFSG